MASYVGVGSDNTLHDSDKQCVGGDGVSLVACAYNSTSFSW